RRCRCWAGRRWPRPSAARVWSCRSPSAAPRRRWGWRGSTPPRPSRRDCGRASRSGGSGSRPATSPGTPAGSRRPVHAALDVLGQLAERAVAGRQLRPGVADADHRPAVEQVVRQAQALEPAAVVEALLAVAAEPLLAAERPFAGVAHVLGIPARVGAVAAPGKIPGATHLVAKGCYRPGICQK